MTSRLPLMVSGALLIATTMTRADETGLREYWSGTSDLDGDGSVEQISVWVNTIHSFPNEIRVDEHERHFWTSEHVSKFEIVDIDTTDGAKEMVVHLSGPSDDYFTDYFWFDGEKIEFMGSAGEHVSVDGAGNLNARNRGRVLCTWFYEAIYRLSADHTLVPRDSLYSMNIPVHVIADLPLYRSRHAADPREVLRPTSAHS